MYLVSWIFVGLATGWLAGKALKGETYGPLMDIAMGIGGAVAAGFLMRFAGFKGYQGDAITTLIAMFGAILLTLAVGLVNGRRLSVRQV
jgi:uncharacterized membrane protein YeaQ/YmgE (transglycosylase-associated protein family)